MTPCVVGVGNPQQWNGVPCKGDGNFEWSGVYLLDRISRVGLEAAVREVVETAPLGWTCLGGEPLTEPDEFLAPPSGRLDQSAPAEVLDRHYAVFLLDPAQRRLHWWHQAAWQSVPADAGALAELPGWYPQPPKAKPAPLAPMPAEVKKELQKRTLAWDLRWDVMLRAMRSWLTGRLVHALATDSPAWVVLDEHAPTHRVFIGDVAVWFALEADRELYAQNGRRYALELSPGSAEDALRGVLRESMVAPMVESWLDLAWKQSFPEGSVSWAVGAKRWSFSRARVTFGLDPLRFHHPGLLPRVFGWLFA